MTHSSGLATVERSGDGKSWPLVSGLVPPALIFLDYSSRLETHIIYHAQRSTLDTSVEWDNK